MPPQFSTNTWNEWTMAASQVKQGEATDVDQRAGNQGQQPERALPTSAHKTRANKRNGTPRDYYAPCREWTRLVIEFFAFLALIYYAWQSGIQATASRDATEIARESFLVGIDVGPELAGQLQRAERYLFVAGYITYRDAFDRERHTTFCMRYTPKEGTEQGDLVLCENGNEAD